jgi:hypothetical protein
MRNWLRPSSPARPSTRHAADRQPDYTFDLGQELVQPVDTLRVLDPRQTQRLQARCHDSPHVVRRGTVVASVDSHVDRARGVCCRHRLADEPAGGLLLAGRDRVSQVEADEPGELVMCRFGPGPPAINVDGPDPA